LSLRFRRRERWLRSRIADRHCRVTALKIEGRQRSRNYTDAVVRTFRAAVEAHARGEPIPTGALAALTEGQSSTRGAYQKTWR